MAQVLEHLPSKYKALSSNSNKGKKIPPTSAYLGGTWFGNPYRYSVLPFFPVAIVFPSFLAAAPHLTPEFSTPDSEDAASD
jgi:hypothetical protein